MINLRYHIVSITAVFLALGIGLTLGSTFLDRVTVDNLNRQLSEVSDQVSSTRREIEDLRGQAERNAQRDAELAEELPEQLLQGRLEGVPVVVVATRGTDEDLVRSAVVALQGAGAQVPGTWWLTDRWSLDDAGARTELAGVLGLDTDGEVRLRRNAAIQLSDLLATAALPVSTDPAAPSPGPSEPPLLQGLVRTGFVDYEAAPGSPDTRVLLPGAGARVVVVSDGLPDRGATTTALALLDQIASAGRPYALAVQGLAELPETPDGPAAEGDRRSTFVGPIRTGEATSRFVATVDDLDLAAGRAALVLVLEGLGRGEVVHVGVGPGAARLLPAPA